MKVIKEVKYCGECPFCQIVKVGNVPMYYHCEKTGKEWDLYIEHNAPKVNTEIPRWCPFREKLKDLVDKG